jgi:hypothetical protein
MAFNQNVNRDEFLKKKLLPFINKYHSDKNYVFWPDLASSDYAETVLDYLIENSINHMDKVDNPANLPECRSIEDFWSILKGKVYANNWIAKDIPTLKKKIKKCFKEVEPITIQSLMLGVVKRIDHVRRCGVIDKRK